MLQEEDPLTRITPSTFEHIYAFARADLQDDTKLAFEQNFPEEELEYWSVIERCLEEHACVIHELRSKDDHELLSARILVYYTARNAAEHPFVLSAWSVTPDKDERVARSLRGKSKGYGSFLLRCSIEYVRMNHPEVFAVVSEREHPKDLSDETSNQVRRAEWHKHNGFAQVQNFSYEIPPFIPQEHGATHYIPVYARQNFPVPADLLLLLMNGRHTVRGAELISIVERLYFVGYGVNYTDPYMSQRVAMIDSAKSYSLENIPYLLV